MSNASSLAQSYNYLSGPMPLFLDGIICQTASVAEGNVLVVGSADGTCTLPSGADTSKGVIGLAAVAGAANTTSTIKILIGGLGRAKASGTITRGDSVTVASSAGDVKSMSATTAENAQVIGTAMESATTGNLFWLLIDVAASSVAGQTADQVPFHSVRGVVTSNVSALATFTVAQGDITYVAGDRVLLAGQTTAKTNGIYVVGTVGSGTAPLTRPVDFVTGATLPAGTIVAVSEGTYNGAANTLWAQTTAGSALVIDTSSITFAPAASGRAGWFHMARGVCWTNQSTSAFASVTAGTIIDGVTYAKGDRVLLAGQTAGAQNGLWVVGTVSSGTAPLSRPTDYASGALFIGATTVAIQEGTLRAGSIWRSTTATSAKVIDTDSIAFAQILDAGQGVNPKVRCVATAAITIATALVTGQVIDGVTLAAGDRVLVTAQATGAQNGVYEAGAAPVALTFAPDYVQGAVKAGQIFEVSEGTVFANTSWKLTTAQVSVGGYITVGTTTPVFLQRFLGIGAGNVREVRCVAATNVTIATALVTGQVIDGVTLLAGDRVLCANQSTGAQSGIYIAGAAPVALQYASDYAQGLVSSETIVSVSEGTLFAHSLWRLGTAQAAAGSSITVGTTSVLFSQMLDAGQTVNPKVRCASSVAVTISTALVTGQVIDGVTLAAGDRVLLTNQSTAGDNGVYLASAAPAAHVYAPDYVQGAVKAGQTFDVAEGTLWANSTWKATAAQVSTGGYYTVGTTDPVFYPRMVFGTGAVGTQVTAKPISATTNPKSAMDNASAAAVKAVIGSAGKAATIDFTGTGTDAVSWCVFNW